MSKSIARKPFYALAEVCDRWSLSPSDIAAYALVGELSLSLPVAGVLVSYRNTNRDPNRPPYAIACEQRQQIGTMELSRLDAFTALSRGAADVSQFFTESGDVLDPIDDQGAPRPLHVERADLVVRHGELAPFEARHAKLPPLEVEVPGSPPPERRRRGAPPQYDWEGVLCEMIVVVNEEGVPATQTEMMKRMEDWFVERLGSDNAPSRNSLRTRVQRFWPRIKPDVGKPSALSRVDR